jgi:hypothetical protein
LVTRQQAVAVLPLPDLAKQWAAVVPSVVPVVTPTGISINSQGAHDTVAALISIPVLTQNLATQTEISGNLQQELTESGVLNAALGTQVVALNQEIAADKILLTKSDEASIMTIAALKADARKSKRNWFIAGFVSGIATRILFKF